MAGKITIRHIGSKLPVVCLLLLLVLCGGTVWLSTQGFPSSVLRYIERKAAEQGVNLHLDALKIAPSQGIALQAEGVSVYASDSSAEGEKPLVSVKSALMGVNLSYLMLGEVRPSMVRLNQGEIRLPVTDPAGESLVIDDIHIAARMGRGTVAQLSSGRLRVQGIPIKLQGSLDLAKLMSEGDEEKQPEKPLDLETLLTEAQPTLNRVYKLITDQHWEQGDTPTLDVRLDAQEDWRAVVRSHIPRFDIGQFHFRDAEVDLQYNKKTISINTLRFKTLEPEASASLQGGYDVQRRHLSFSMRSTAALLRMVRSMSDGPLQEYLFKFRHPDDEPPHIVMSGDVVFEDDYTLQSARVRGNVQQKSLRVGSTQVDEAELSFFYDNGNFNIDKLELLFPDGSLQGVASAQDGVGQAQVVADLPVQKVLTLVSELAEQEVTLPEGLVLGERVQLQLQARLTTPAFKPGQTHWQGFVPKFHMLGMKIQSPLLEYEGYKLISPEVGVQMSDIVQRRSLLLRSLGGAHLTIRAQEMLLPVQESAEAALKQPTLSLDLQQVEHERDGIPRKVELAKLQVQAEGASLQGGQEAAAGGISAELELHELSMDEGMTPESLRAALASLHVQVEQLAADSLKVGKLELRADQVKDLLPLRQDGGALFTGAQVEADAVDLVQGELAVGDVTLHAQVQESTVGSLSVELNRKDGSDKCVVSATTDWTSPEELIIRDIQVDLPESTSSMALELFGESVADVEMPRRVSLSGECVLRRADFGIRRAHFSLDIPELVRTPHRLAVFRGKRIPLAVQAEVDMRGESKLLYYDADLKVTQATGVFSGHISGSSAGSLKVTGENTILPNVVDMLIDNEDAHSIIRDFRFPSNSKVTISGIQVGIDYSRGLAVDSFCRVDLLNTEYLISVIQDGPNGTEYLRKDLSNNPYTFVTRGSCTVSVKVREDCKAENGTPLPNESVVTIDNALLVYDNSPWFRRQKWDKGTRETRLQADSVIIDIEHSFVEIVNVRGNVYPAYSLGMFYPDLQHYMEDVILTSPSQVETPRCVFPIYSDCKRPMSGTIRAMAPVGASFRFLGTTIPLEDFSGFIFLTDDYVLLDRMNAKSWEGVLDAAVKIGISGKRTSFDGYAKAQCMNLQLIAAAYGSKQAPALCNGQIRFRSPSPSLQDIQAYGKVEVENGDLMSLGLFQPVSAFITDLPAHFTRLEEEAAAATGHKTTRPSFFSRLFTHVFNGLGKLVGRTGDQIGRTASYIPGMNHLIAYDLQEAYTHFDILNGHFITRGMKAKGYNLNVSLNLDINLDTLEIHGNLWPRVSSLPTVLLSPLSFLSDFMVDIILYGDVGDIKWRIGLDRRPASQPPSATSEPDKSATPRAAKR